MSNWLEAHSTRFILQHIPYLYCSFKQCLSLERCYCLDHSAHLSAKHTHWIKEAAFRHADNPLVQSNDSLTLKGPINTCVS